jgi:hypothetical protein
LWGQAVMDRRGKFFFIYLYFFGDADFEEKFLNIKYKKLIEEREIVRKPNGAKRLQNSEGKVLI